MVNMRRKTALYLLPLLLFIFILSPMLANAEDSKIFDEANLLSEEEVAELESQANAISSSYNMDIIIVSTDDAQGKTCMEYADECYDLNGFGVGEDLDGVLFLIDMDNRETYVLTSGKAIDYLTDQRIDEITTHVVDNGLADEDYFAASQVFLDDLEGYLESGIPSDQYSEEENTLTIIEILISLLVAAAAALGFFFFTKSRYKMADPVKQVNVKKNSKVDLAVRDDKFIDKVVTSRAIPKKDDSSGKSSTHQSSSGKTHGGGGKKF